MTLSVDMLRLADLLEKSAEVIDAQEQYIAELRQARGADDSSNPAKLAEQLRHVLDASPDEASQIAQEMAGMSDAARESLLDLLSKTAAHGPDHTLGGPVTQKAAQDESGNSSRGSAPKHHQELDAYFQRLYAMTGGSY